MCLEKNHEKSVHKGQKFQCPSCEHKSTQKGSLQKHIKSIHEGQKFQCPQCEYKANWKGDLQTHIQSVSISADLLVLKRNRTPSDTCNVSPRRSDVPMSTM